MDNNALFKVTVYTEDKIGLLSTIANIFTRRSVNIDSLTAFPTDFPGIHRITIKSRTTEEQIIKIVNQIEKKVDVIKSFYYFDTDSHVKESLYISEFLKNLNK